MTTSNNLYAMDRRALIDERIRSLLTSTDLTFKQIIETLKVENIPASFNTIRRVNRNHRYRKPRYDAKLTPQQRKQLVVELKNTSKPNLSSLARKYGVCHGSIWYWWDKLSKIREKNNGIVPNNEPSLDFDDLDEQEFLPRDEDCLAFTGAFEDNSDNQDDIQDDDIIADLESDPLDLSEEDGYFNRKRQKLDDYSTDPGGNLDDGDVDMIGAVKAKDWEGNFIELPILMYAPVANRAIDQSTSKSIGSGASSSSAHSTPSTSTSSNFGETSSSLCKRLTAS